MRATNFPYSVLGAHNPFGTTAILSRHPLRDMQILDLGADRSAVSARTTIYGRDILFLSAHLMPYTPLYSPWQQIPSEIEDWTFKQNRQAQRLVSQARASNDVVILGCDCNAQETSNTYQTLERALTNSTKVDTEHACGQISPILRRDSRDERLDYIFFRGALQAQGTYLLSDWGGSDHSPVLGLFGIVPGSRRLE